MDTPAPAPAAPADVSAAPSAAPQTTQQRMLARAQALRVSAVVDDAAPAPADQQADGVTPTAETERQPQESGERGDSREGQDTQDEPKTIPMAAFKERLGRATEKNKQLQTEVAARDLDLQKARHAVQLLQQELEAVTAKHREGAAYDPRDEQLREADMERRAREIASRVQAEHEETLRKQAAAYADEVRHEQLRASYARDIDSALSQYDLVDRSLLIAALRQEASKAKPASAQTLAASIHAGILERSRKHLGPSARPDTPATTRSPGGGPPPVSHPNNAAGMLARVREIRGG